MSNQFYKYLSKKLIEYLNHNAIKAGERYYIQLDEMEQVEKLYNTLREEANTSKFIYKNDVVGKGYETYSIKVGDVNLVVASAINVTSGYLVTIRNASKEQLNEWENTSLLILCSETLDSIKGGCRDLRKDGMPFSIRSISQNLVKEIETKDLSKIDKEIVKFYIQKKLSDFNNTSLWDYEEILGIMNKGIVESKDYAQIGLFVDSALDTFNITGIQKRLKENSDLFTKVEGYQEYEDKEQQLEKLFDDKGVDTLKKDNWKTVDFTKVKKSFEANRGEKPLEYIENAKHITEEGARYWEKSKSDTSSGRRKRHIIVFNNGQFKETTLIFKFSDNLSKEYIPSTSTSYISVAGKKMTVKLPNDLKETSFYKLVYNHKKQSKSKYEFNIAIVNIKESSLANIITNYEIRIGSKSKNRILINNNESGIKFGQGLNIKEVDIENEDDILTISEDETIKISNSSPAWNDDILKFILNDEKGIVPIEIKEESLRSRPINSINLLKYKRENKENFIWEDNKIKQGTNEFYLDMKLKSTLNREKEIVDKAVMHGKEGINGITDIKINISDELVEAYKNIINYYKINDSIPTLTYLNDEIINLYKIYINIYNKEIDDIKEKEILLNNITKKDLLKLGVIETESKIMFSPFAPINIAYSIELYEQLQSEIIEPHILERLSQNNLLPYIYNNKNELYKPIYQKDNVEWIIFEKKENVSIGETNAFVAKVVKEKLHQFISNFSYLFPKHSSAPIKINVINIKNDKEVVKGVFEYIKNQIIQNVNKIIPIEVRVFNNEEVSEFDKFFSLSSIEKLESEFDINFSTNNNQFDEVDIMRMAFENIKCYKSNTSNYPYAHISFYKVGEDEKAAEDNTNSMESGLSLGGLLSAVTSNNTQSDYRIGFGRKHMIESNQLINTALNINQLAVNGYNNGVNPYRKDTSIVTRPLILHDDIKNKLYNSSHWITFIEPNFGLEYFEESENNNLVVIHYSDQYTATDHYDTITVTNKVQQYKHIIQEFLKQKEINIIDEKINEVIKSFNSINGEWLLNLISNRGEYDREKLSIISAVKYMLSILEHEDIIWIPISSEEVLRVSNAVKLNKSGGIFSLKNLEQKGVHSDDLIFIGIDICNIEELKVYYYPVEVKVGYNFSSTIDKGRIQINKTYDLLKEQLNQYIEEDRKLFKNKFFRNFFIKLLLSNAQKLYINKIWPQKQFERLDKVKHLLLNDNYLVSFKLEEFIGKGALISFKKDNHFRSITKENQILCVELTEDDAYNGIAKSVHELSNEIENKNSDITSDDLLRSKIINTNRPNKDKLSKETEVIDISALEPELQKAVEIAKNLLDILDEETISIKTGLDINIIKSLKK